MLLCSNLVFCLAVLQEGNETDFNDLGKLLLGGVLVAIVCAVAFTFVRFRLRDRKPQTSSFVSISSPPEKK